MDSEDFKIISKKNQNDKSQSIRKMWELMAQRPSDFDMQVIDALKATITNSSNGNGNSNDNENIYGCYGEKVYLTIREQLINEGNHTYPNTCSDMLISNGSSSTIKMHSDSNINNNPGSYEYRRDNSYKDNNLYKDFTNQSEKKNSLDSYYKMILKKI
jgi:hypothetical protein